MEKSCSQLFNMKELKQGLQIGSLPAVDPEIYSKFIDHITQNVKEDTNIKSLLLKTGLSAYSDDPLNLALKGPSSIGKSYTVKHVLRYFPPNDVWFLGGMSPKALIHGYGILCDENDKEIDQEERPTKTSIKLELREFYSNLPESERKQVTSSMVEDELRRKKKDWNERLKKSRYIIDLRNRILVFLEAPNRETFNILRPILSHDVPEISYRITDKTRSGSLRTKHVVIRNFPATILCSTDLDFVEDFATRNITATPEVSTNKFLKANKLTGTRNAFPWEFEDDYDFSLLQHYIGWLRESINDIENAVVPYAEQLSEHYPSRYARSMRDFAHFLSLVKVSALFNFAQRPFLKIGDKEYLLATRWDYEHVLETWETVEETTITGLPGHILNFFHVAVEPLSKIENEFTYEQLTEKYNESATEKKSRDTIKKWIGLLCDIGWTSRGPHPEDKRKRIVSVIKNPENSGKNGKHDFPSFFSEKNLENWLDRINKIREQKPVLFKEKMQGEYFSLDNPEHFSRISKPIIKQEYSSKTEKKIEDDTIPQSPEKSGSLTIQETLNQLREIWKKGTINEFDVLISEARGCSKEEAEKLRETWIDKDGLLAYDPKGFLVWIK